MIRGDARELTKFWPVVQNMVTQDLRIRYHRSFLGFFWTLLNPILMMATLTMVFSQVFGQKDWKEFAIFVIEDDAQNGPDSVDSHRTVGLVISPYTRRQHLDSTMYTTTSMLRTMELILGIAPLTQHDAAATPMFESFTNVATLTPYQALPAQIDVTTRNTATSYGAKQSARMDWSDYDRINEDKLKEMGVADDLARRYLDHPVYTPRQDLLLVDSLHRLGGVTGRDKYLDAAMVATDEVEANFFVNMAQILRGYHEKGNPITGITMVGPLTVAQTKAGATMIPFALDHGVWTANADKLSRDLK